MKRFAWLAAIGVWVLAACSPQSAAPTTAPDAPTPPTAATQPPAPTAAVTAAPTVEPQQITRDMVFKPQPGEWVRGPEDALVTIIEWGDFQ
jgi:multidrug efflux pump subunit AcrA (membrane-fusion protein)